MIEIKMWLASPHEVNLLARFTEEIEQLRRAEYVEVTEVEAVPVKREHDHTMPPPYNPEPTPAQAVATILRHAQPTDLTQAQMEDAIKAYGRAKGFPAARALLDEYVPGGKIKDVPQEKWPELHARATA